MRSGMVVLLEPVIDDDLGLLCCGEPFGIEKLPSQRAVEPFVVAVLPGRSRIDVDRLYAYASEPALHCFGSKLRPVTPSE